MPETCKAEKAAMLCTLPPGHPGLHYDSIDDIFWMSGEVEPIATHDEGTSYCTSLPEHEGHPRCLS